MPLKTHLFAGTTIYECPWCPFDSQWEATVKVHVVQCHPERLPAPPPPTERAPEATLYAPTGDLVTAIPIPAADAAAELPPEMAEDVQISHEESE